MPAISSEIDERTLTLVLTAEFDAPPTRVRQLWADARQLEQWWGPPGWPATFSELELVEGGRSRYSMTGPGGERPPDCWFRFTRVEHPALLEFDDHGFFDGDGQPDSAMGQIDAILSGDARASRR